MKTVALFLFVCSTLLLADPLHFAVELDGKTLLFIRVADKKVRKAYPKPEADLGEMSVRNDGVIEFRPIPKLDDPDNFFPLLGNVVSFSDLDKETSAKLAEVIQKSGDVKLLVKDNKVVAAQKAVATVPWDKIQLVPVEPKELKKIEAMEKAFLGKWKFIGGEKALGDRKQKLEGFDIDLFKGGVEFCPEGKCVLDGKEKHFYWSDGKFSRLSFQKTNLPKDYNREYEYDILQIDDKKLVIRTISAPFPDSILKLTGKYPKFESYTEYYFERVK